MTLVLAGCGTSEVDRSGTLRLTSKIVRAASSGEFPVDSLRDWKSYSDHLAVVAIESDRQVEMTRRVQTSGEGHVGRVASVLVEDMLWSAPHAPELPQQFEMIVPGWILEDGELRMLQYGHAPRIEVGGRYVIPLVLKEGLPVPWAPLGVETPLPVEASTIAPVDIAEGGGAVFKQLVGRSVQDVAGEFDQVEPEPLAWKHRELRPLARVDAVLAEGGFGEE